MSPPVVLGLDLSLRSTGMVAIPSDWKLDWARVRVAAAGRALRDDATVDEQLSRLAEIRDDVVAFARETGATVAYVLGYAYNKAQVSRAHAAGELGGVVKLALAEANVEVQVIVESRARTLFGKAPRKDAKIWATQRLVAAGAPRSWTQDQLDAVVAANWGVSELGGDALIIRDQTELPFGVTARDRRGRSPKRSSGIAPGPAETGPLFGDS